MFGLKIWTAASVAMLAGACATPPPEPVELDTNVPSAVEETRLALALRVVGSQEIDSFFGGGASGRLRVVELQVENRRTTPASLALKGIVAVTPNMDRQEPLTPLGAANLTRGVGGMASTGTPALDWIQAAVGLVNIKRNLDRADSWSWRMPAELQVAPGQRGVMWLALAGPVWTAGTWRFELPFTPDSSWDRPIVVLLAFKPTGSAPKV